MLGVVLQDVVADAMSTEVVPRVSEDGTPRPDADIERDLGFVQILGRLALSLGAFIVAGLGGYLAKVTSYETVFLISLVIPVISASVALLVKLETSETRPTDWRILGGGLLFGLVVTMLALLDAPYNQEIVLIISLAVIIAMLARVTREISPETRRKIVYAALIIFAFRATPSVGEGYRWFMIDALGFDEAFFGTLAQIGAGIGLAAAWLLSDAITRKPVATVLFWLTVLGGLLAIPNLILVYRADLAIEAAVGIGARGIALIDAAAASPLAQLSMVPLLTLIAIYAPPSHRATWFALMASFMNLALVTGQLATKYLNSVFVVQRGMYGELPVLTVVVSIIGLLVPLAAIAVFGRNLKSQPPPTPGT